MSKIIVPLEPQSSPFAHMTALSRIRQFGGPYIARADIREPELAPEAVCRVVDGADPKTVATALKLAGFFPRLE